MKIFLTSVVIITAFCALTYVSVQQQARQAANDLPRQLVEQTVIKLNSGQSPQQLKFSDNVDVATEASPFVAVYSDQGKVVAGNALLHETPLQAPPHGVFQYAHDHDVNQITWQPEPGVRLATVTIPWHNNQGSGYVVAGQSLRIVEQRLRNLTHLTALTWLLCVVLVSAIIFVLPDWTTKAKRKK